MIRLLFAAVLICGAALLPARAETTLCTEITSVPTTISAQGIYCLKNDLSTSITAGAAITIAANNVTIDCNDRKVGGLAAGDATQAYGIYAGGTIVNSTVRNCNIRGFHTGIRLGQVCGSCTSSGQLVENNLLDQNTKEGIHVEGDRVIVRDNRVNDTGGSVIGGAVIGIRAHGFPALVFDNIVGGTFGPPFAADTVGIHYSGYMSTGRGNVVNDTIEGSSGLAAGIRAGGTTIFVDGNLVANTTSTLDYGIDVVYGALCRNNTIAGATNRYDICTDGGGNYPAIP